MIGHAKAHSSLVRAARSGRQPHAWLISGPRGIGKATLTYAFARSLIADRPGDDIGPEHPVFRAIAHNAHPDLTVIELPRDPQSGKLKSEIPVDAVRDSAAHLHATAVGDGPRLLIVDGADRLNRNAANAALKLVEEPPRRLVIFLVAHRAERVPSTLRSRCAKLRLAPLARADVEDGLTKLRPEIEQDTRRIVGHLAHGSIGRAMLYADAGWSELYVDVVRHFAAASPSVDGQIDLAEALARMANAHGVDTAMDLMQELLHRALHLALGSPIELLLPEEQEALRRLAGSGSLDRLGRVWDKLGRLAGQIEQLSLDRKQAFLYAVNQMVPA